MKKIIIFLGVILFGSLVTSSPICSINQELNKDTATKLQDFRNQTLKTCMQCNGNSCKLKEWSKDKKGDESICKLLFCTPSYVSKFFEKNLISDEIIIGMGAGSISQWMRELEFNL